MTTGHYQLDHWTLRKIKLDTTNWTLPEKLLNSKKRKKRKEKRKKKKENDAIKNECFFLKKNKKYFFPVIHQK
jgi:hypothetical protein